MCQVNLVRLQNGGGFNSDEGTITVTLDDIVIKNIVATMRQLGSYCCDNGDNGNNSDNGKFREKNPV